MLRGVVNPAFDLLTAKQRRVQDVILDAEIAASQASATSGAGTGTDS